MKYQEHICAIAANIISLWSIFKPEKIKTFEVNKEPFLFLELQVDACHIRYIPQDID